MLQDESKEVDLAPLTAEVEMELLGRWIYEQINFIDAETTRTHYDSNLPSSSPKLAANSQLEPSAIGFSSSRLPTSRDEWDMEQLSSTAGSVAPPSTGVAAEAITTREKRKPFKERKRLLLFSFTGDGEFVENKEYAAESAAYLHPPPEQASSSRQLGVY